MATKKKTTVKKMTATKKPEPVKNLPPGVTSITKIGEKYVKQTSGAYKGQFVDPKTGMTPTGLNTFTHNPDGTKKTLSVAVTKKAGSSPTYINDVNEANRPVKTPKGATVMDDGTVFKTDLEETADFAESLGFDRDVIPETWDEIVQKQKEQQAREMGLLQDSNALSNAADETDYNNARDAGVSSIAARDAAMAPNREGGSSQGNNLVRSQYRGMVETKLNQAFQALNLAKRQRAAMEERLQEAQDQDNGALVAQLQSEVSRAAAEEAAAQAEILGAQKDLLAEDRAFLEEQRAGRAEDREMAAEKRMALGSFQSLVEGGTELTTDAILGLSKTLGLPFEDLYGYYEGADAIRQDKTLTLEEKKMKLADGALDLERKVTGRDDEDVRSLDLIQQMRREGVSEEIINSFMSAKGFVNEKDPLRMAQIRVDNATAAIKEYEAANLGQPPAEGTIERLDYDIKKLELQKAQKEMQNTFGTGSGAYVPSGTPKEGIVVSYENGQFLVTSPAGRKFSCAAGVNRTYGTKFGDSYTQKAGIINQAVANGTGILAEDVTDASTQIKAGMIFVMPIAGKLGGSGHVGIVKSVDPVAGTFTTYEWNADGAMRQGGVFDGKNNQTTETRKISQMYGFMQPPNTQPVGVDRGGYSDKQKKVLNSLSSLDAKDLDTTTLKVLEDAGLTTSDLLSYEPDQEPLPDSKVSEVNDILSAIDELKNMDMSGAIGASFQKALPWVNSEDGFIAGTDAANFKAQFDQFRDNLVLPSLDKLKGAMSDKDIQFLRNAATALNLDMSEEQFMKELNKLEKKYQEILNKGSGRKASVAVEDSYIDSLDLDDVLLDEYLNNI